MNARLSGPKGGVRTPRRRPQARLVPLSGRFFARHTLRVARDLLGHLLVHDTPHGRVVGRIVEVEAYRGPTDPASHAFRKTPRSQIMWGRPGTAYVYFTYGNHFCMNVVTEPEGKAGAILLRAVEPIGGTEIMRRNRGVHDDRLLASGPGRLTQAFAVDRAHNGVDLAHPPLYLARGRTTRVPVRTSPRIGIRVAVARPWRFYIPDHPCLSR